MNSALSADIEAEGTIMPLLLCPNDNGAMQTIQRSGVEFDMCPTCRGVWLDRGELEKLMAVEQDGPAPMRTEAPRFEPRRSDDYRRADDDHRRGYHKKKSSLFDIFD